VENAPSLPLLSGAKAKNWKYRTFLKRLEQENKIKRIMFLK